MNCILNNAAMQLQSNLRLLHTSSRLYGIAKMMKKVMKTGSEKRKFKYYETSMPSTPAAFSKGLFEGSQSVNSKRAKVLNKLFMRYITDLMATGECSSYFVGHGIEVSHVQISPDFSYVNIYWIARGTEKDNIIEDILKTRVGVLRHELSQLKLVGIIPKLQFVKDKHYARSAEVDRLLAIADYGDDYVPVDIATKLTTRLELNTNLDPPTIDKLQTLENSVENIYDEPVPPMPHNIFNLNHSEMMERILKSKTKSQAPHRLLVENELHSRATTVNENIVQFANEHEERVAFRNFLHKRQVLKDKILRADKNYQPELEYLQEEWLERQKKHNEYENNLEETDYIEEEIDQK